MSEAASHHERLTALFSDAVEMSVAERTALVARLRASEPQLAEDLAALLAADAAPRVETGSLKPTLDDLPAPRDRVTTLQIPGYRIRNILGEGGMGTVYLADQEEPERRVAIKVLHARSSNALVRFKTEAQIMARLDHPCIARVLEAGEADGHPFLVMEYVEGQNLDDYVTGRTRAERLELVVQICDAVHHAHVKGVIHRDLKPTNVMVRTPRVLDRTTQTTAQPVILDFGVARLAADDGSTPGATRAGELVGTPLYMSPEQARLQANEVDARSDVYTLGVILYELLCGDLPYGVKGLPLPAITVVICEDPPVPLGKRDPDLRGDLEAIADKALQKEPELRYQSVAALAEDIRRHLEGLPVSVRTPGSLERVQRFVRRRPLVAATIAGSVIATATFAGVVTGLWLDAREAREIAEGARGVAESARAELEVRSNQLVLGQARAALARDPTDAIAWLATLTANGVDAGTAWAIADEAVARGVARDVLKGHSDEVHWIEALPSGDGFVTGGYDGLALAWSGPAFRPVRLVAATGRVHIAVPSPDGMRVAIGADEGELWVVSFDGTQRTRLDGHRGDVQHVVWSHDGAWLATGDDRGGLYVWPRGGAPGTALEGSKVAIGAVAFSTTNELVAGDHEGRIWMWDLATKTRRETNVGTDIVSAWSDGATLVSVDVEGVVRTWKIDGAALVLTHTVTTKIKTKRAVFAAFGSWDHASWVVLGGVGGAVTRVQGEGFYTLDVHRSQVRSLAVSPDRRWIADGTDDGVLELRDLATDRVYALRGHGGRIRHVDFTHDSAVLLSSDSDGVIRRWELATVRHGLLDASGAPAAKLAASQDATQIASVDTNGVASLWSLADERHTRLGKIEGRVTELALAARNVVIGTAEGAVTWVNHDVLTSKRSQHIEGTVTSIATSHERVAVASSAGPIVLFDDAATVGGLAGHAGGTDAIAFSPGGDLLASGGQDRVIRVWKREGDSYLQLPPLEAGLRGDTHFVKFAPETGVLVVAGNDGAVIAWATSSGAVDPVSQHVITRHTGAVTALAFESRGAWVASAGRDATVVRTRIDRGGRFGESETAKLHAAAIEIAIDEHGEVHAITRTGAVERWSRGQGGAAIAPVVEIEHGARTAVPLAGGRDDATWALAFDDGTILLERHRDSSFAELAARVRAITTHRR